MCQKMKQCDPLANSATKVNMGPQMHRFRDIGCQKICFRFFIISQKPFEILLPLIFTIHGKLAF